MKKGFKDNTWTVAISYSNLFNGIRYHSLTSDINFVVDTKTIAIPYAQIIVSYLLNNQK
jgi:hypothetical protein